jgi:hypothetical protein
VHHGGQFRTIAARLQIEFERRQITIGLSKPRSSRLKTFTVQYRGGIANYLQVITSQTSTLQNQRTAVDNAMAA